MHADLACGIAGFTLAAQSLGASTVWACDVDREATQAYNAAHAHAFATPARCHPIELCSQWAQRVGVDLISACFPYQACNKVRKRQGYRDARSQVIFHLIQLCWVLKPAFMVLEWVWPFFENPQWLEPVRGYFLNMGYGLTIRREQASDYLAQIRTRGILTATKHDYWHLATGPLQALFSGTPPPRGATVGSARVLGPHPPLDSPLYPTDAQARCYSPAQYVRNSWT